MTDEFRPRLGRFKGSHVYVWIRGLADDVGFATSLIRTLESAGIQAEYVLGGTTDSNGKVVEAVPIGQSANDEFARQLAALMSVVTGVKYGTGTIEGPASEAAITIPHALSAVSRTSATAPK